MSLSDFPSVSNAKWSPDSRKIAIKTLGENRLSIIHLEKGNETNLVIKKIEYYGSDDEKKYINDPAWSPDSKYLFYKKTTEDGHKILGTDIWSLNVETKESVFIDSADSQNPVIAKIVVSNNFSVFTIQGNDINNARVILNLK